MKNFPALPYMYHKLFKSFSYSVDRWIEMERGDACYKKRTTRSDFTVTREWDVAGNRLLTWATTQNITVKLELYYHVSDNKEKERAIVIKYGEKKALVPKQLGKIIPADTGQRKIKKEVYLMVRELLKQNAVR